MSTRQNNTEQKEPRRSRLPRHVYEAADRLESGLSDFESKWGERFKGDHTDEVLCQEAIQPLRNISSLAFQEELDSSINEHLHNDPDLCRRIVIEAMRLAYGIQDLIDAGKRVSKFERARCENLFDHYQELKKATDASYERDVARVRGKSKPPSSSPREGTEHYRAGFDWPYFGIHCGDTLIVESGPVKPGQLVYVLYENEDGGYFNRCCAVKDGIVRVVGDDDDDGQLDKPLESIVGPVVEIRHDNCIQPKLEALRQKLAELRDDTDHTLNLTRCFEIEKEIFDLENTLPEVEDSDSDEWPEVIGDE